MRRIWRGRCRDRTWKCFLAAGDRLVSTGTLVQWIWPRLSRHRSLQYHRARLAALELADPVCRSSGRGREM
jgi:hypothetical protein